MRYIDAVGTTRRYSKIGLGTWQFGSREWGYGPEYDGAEAARIVRRALELGVTVFDTAELYGFGRSERILGAALRTALEQTGTSREDIVVASKILPVLPVSPVVQQRGVASCARLGLGPIDLYQVHRPHPLVHDASTMRGMRALREAGVIRDVGVSNHPVARWRRAEAELGSPVLTDQVHYSLLARTPERRVIPYAERAGRIVMAYSPLAQGLLTGKFDAHNRPARGIRAMNPLFLPENLDRVRPLLGLLRDIADAHGATPAQVALAWTIRHPAVMAIPGASGVEQLESNAAAAELDLTPSETDALSEASRGLGDLDRVRELPRLLRDRLSRRPRGR
ncbi:aryl-alcohol dehydrogenase-like predicted oxidoreductase [Nocardiopsis mwathae]|uniref:Aryl-alcohol dehydrogenase-like predicted oxidoreductase n=1 Tax=Nocardiopsis mwathae TaxID=1472723 RepID=A0A7X0D5A7_9ACTN|nr:aldo/keto reductase [Nocardiopsis mwathae]MBB6172010.1 aryl-alcohol dehydrogenase-like predicted oxidoreductase [Nocardiopsis mwathae]